MLVIVPKIEAWGHILLKRKLNIITNDTRCRKRKLEQQNRVWGNEDLNTKEARQKICIEPKEVDEHKKQPDNIRDHDQLRQPGNAQPKKRKSNT